MQTCVSHCRTVFRTFVYIRELGIVNSRRRELGLDDSVLVILLLGNESHLWYCTASAVESRVSRREIVVGGARERGRVAVAGGWLVTEN